MRDTSTDRLQSSLRRSVKTAKALANSTEIALAQSYDLVLGSLSNLFDASALNPDPGKQDVLYDELIGEIQALINQQQKAAESRTQCWNTFNDALEAIRQLLQEKHQNHEDLTEEDRARIELQIAHAVEAFNRCMALPRPLEPIPE
jgi:hypothetical protein